MEFFLGTLFGLIMGMVFMSYILKPFFEWCVREVHQAVEDVETLNTKER